MANLLLVAQKRRKYDAIVIGSGATGGWAAKEFCDHGLKTLVLERVGLRIRPSLLWRSLPELRILLFLN
ncbi:MAG: hypothetical protein OEQ53_21350 [Saprospiraceae bacterium]|nr:hypothetical protein [Saprospiraceae bacterium]